MISFEDVTKRYSRTIALNHLSLELEDHKIYCLLGCNGAGKTTMMKMIAGHFPASSGIIRIDGQSVSTLRTPECVHFIESRGSQFNCKLKKLIRKASDLQDEFDLEFAQRMLRKFRLDEEKKYRNLSFGMQTMVTAILSLASNSKIILLDEPVLGLDAIMRSQFYELLTESFENHPRLIIVSTHLIDEIAKSAHELLILDGGNILFRSSINEIDEKAYSVTGMTKDVENAVDSLHVIGRKTIGGFTTAMIYDRRISFPDNLSVQPLGLQEFFINMVGGDQDERQHLQGMDHRENQF